MSNIVLLIAIVVFVFSGFKLYNIYTEYEEGEEEYEAIINEVIIQVQEHTEDTEKEEEHTGETPETEEQTVFKVDFDKLKSMNEEVVAWIRFEEPSQISYPVVQATDNSKYLKTTFEGKSNSAGALFVDAINAGDFSDDNTFIYGHNMKNGTMFGQLRKYKDATFCKTYPYFYLYTPDGKEMQYQVFAVCIVEGTSESYHKFYTDDAEYLQYIEYIRSIARYKVDVEVTAQSQIVSLSTCTNVTDTQRLLVHGVKVNEKIVGE